MAFESVRVKESLVMPAAGAVTFLLAELVAASIDSKRADVRPYAQNTVTAVGAVGSLWAIGTNKVPKFAMGVLMGCGVGIVANLLKYGYDQLTKQAAHINPADVGAIIAPRMVGQLSASGGGGGGLKLELANLGKGTLTTTTTAKKTAAVAMDI
jgi:hypothetical protein